MKRKSITRAEWRGIYRRAYAEQRFEWAHVRGMAGLITMTDAEDFRVRSGGERIQITGQGYSWLELAPEDKNVWATVMFDPSGRLFQCYFDITAGNHVLDEGQSYFDDLYLDLVVRADSDRMFLCDDEELEAACKSGEITLSQRDTAYAARRELIDFICAHKQEFFSFCRQMRQKLMGEQEPTEA